MCNKYNWILLLALILSNRKQRKDMPMLFDLEKIINIYSSYSKYNIKTKLTC